MKKVLAWILTLTLMMTLFPTSAMAETHTHSYENGVCSECGEEHPNLANYKGKVISILGDSISTFAGYIPVADGFNLQHYARYPQDNLFTDVAHTWWMQVLTALNAKLGINESWRSTEVGNIYDVEVNSGYEGTKACMASTTRIQNLGSNGTPDVILFYGGTNDITQRRVVGSFDSASAPTEVDLTSVKWDTVADAYVAAIMRMQYYYPDAEIIAMLPTFTYKNTDAVIENYNSVFAAICEHYGVSYVDLRDCGITTSFLPDGTHPNEAGMDYITSAVMDILLTDCHVEAGENIVHSVTHNLINAESGRGYYKGVSHGKSFVTTITGENVTVSVTMGGADITTSVYTESAINIHNVTGDIVINATGREKTVYKDHLQPLPESICSDTNLWTALSPEGTYYTANGWGNLSGNVVYSVTIPVNPGDQLWATSFQVNKLNGNTTSSSNGIRVTWFDVNGVLKAMSPANTYAEFKENGYLTAPEGAVAVNIPMWTGDENQEIYILNLPHDASSDICSICGKDSHVHIWSEWKTVAAPSIAGPGVEQRTCATCEKTQTRAVDGVWQTYDLDEHMVTLPETYCMGTDLWSLLPHDREYYHSGVRWDVNGNVRSVTFAVSGGEHIFATAFGKRGTNGTSSSDGIRLTFFGENGVLKTTTPQETYAEFAANGGYIVVPQGAIAVNVPMYSDGDENDLYILNRPHTYDHAYDADCNHCGAMREVEIPIAFGGNSVSEDVSGLAFSFDVAVEGMTVTNHTTAVYDNATVGEYRLIAMGAIASNGVCETDIPVAYLYAYSDTTASFVIRVIHIPTENYDTEITVIPYMVLLIDGVETTLYGEAQTATVNTILSK